MSNHACTTSEHGLAGDGVPPDMESGEALASPSDFKVEVGAKLLSVREEARRKREEAAGVLGCSVDKIGSIERGRTSVSRMELRALLDFYEADTRRKLARAAHPTEGAQNG